MPHVAKDGRSFLATSLPQPGCCRNIANKYNISATFLQHVSRGNILQHVCNNPATFPQHSCNIALATKNKLHCNKMFVAGVARVNKTEMLQWSVLIMMRLQVASCQLQAPFCKWHVNSRTLSPLVVLFATDASSGAGCSFRLGIEFRQGCWRIC